jgi:hypothetical protein
MLSCLFIMIELSYQTRPSPKSCSIIAQELPHATIGAKLLPNMAYGKQLNGAENER